MSSSPLEPPAFVAPGQNMDSVTHLITAMPLSRRTTMRWWVCFGISFSLMGLLGVSVGVLFYYGVGVWGVDIPVAWGFAIINFVWWVGIGHAGTLISAILYLLRQKWRTSINRYAEAMTLFAVMCAGLFPLLHLGRPWKFYYIVPYPNTLWIWPQWRSPLVWDVFAVGTYFTISLLFWYLGLVPDLATLRDRAQRPMARFLYGAMALGRRNSARHWQRYEMAYLIMAGLATPLVVSVHSVVSLDFAAALLPGWHTTIFPPYFVAGAIFSGFAMVITLIIPLRWALHLEGIITERHFDVIGKVYLTTGLVVAYGYMMEMFNSWYSGDKYEEFMSLNRMFGPYAACYWVLIFCNIVAPQVLWFRKVRTCIPFLFVLSIVTNVGMWMERFVIVVISLHRDWLPSSWGMYVPTFWDWATFAGTLGFFLTGMFLFVRVLPSVSIHEVRQLVEGRQHFSEPH